MSWKSTYENTRIFALQRRFYKFVEATEWISRICKAWTLPDETSINSKKKMKNEEIKTDLVKWE